MGFHSRPSDGLSLCAGGGGLELGVHLAEPAFRCRCYVEWEPAAQAVLVGNMAGVLPLSDRPDSAGADLPVGASGIPPHPAHARRHAGPFHPAPVWDDVRTFVGDAWRGRVNIVTAGYPCQPFSAAGKRGGADDPRHLWPDVARIWWETGAEWGFFENVAGHISLGLETVLRDIYDMGATPAVGLFSSSETGNTHERQRVFILAHRQVERSRKPNDEVSTESRHNARPCPRRGGGGLHGDVAHANVGHTGAERQQRGGELGFQPDSRGDGASPLGDTAGFGWREGRTEHGVWGRRDATTGTDSVMAHACQPRPQGREQPGSPDQRNRTPAPRPAPQCGRPYLCPPGPSDLDAWGHVLAMAPDLAPSLAIRDLVGRANDLAAMVAEGRVAEPQAQSDLRRMADALAARPRALRLYGNGVDPLVSAYALRSLGPAHGLWPVDLATRR